MNLDGRRTVLTVIAIQLGTSALVIGAYLYLKGMDRAPQQAVRFSLSCLICLGLYKGNNVVRVINLILLGLGIAAAALAGLAAMGDHLPIEMIVLFWAYFFAFTLLLKGPGVKEYFRARRVK